MPSRPIDPPRDRAEERTLLTINEAARLVRVNRKTIYRWIHSGILEHCVLPSGLTRIFKDSLIRIPSGRKTAPEGETTYGRPGEAAGGSWVVADSKPAPPRRRRPRPQTS
jgi:excisionase family DNA binding protein